MVDLKSIQDKWQKKWEDAKIFEANPSKKPKFFLSFPYPYINAYQHIGHLYTLTRVDVFARYKRNKGFNVLFPQGWHATGSPIVNAAKRVKDREEKQIKIMRDMGFSEDDLTKFENPEYWVEFFEPEFEKDYKSVGMSIDWRRSFYTTSLNPHYNKFIEWQFRKLLEKGYVIKGKFPVVWDPKEKCPVGDHDRIEGEGVVPQEFCLFKFKLEDGSYIITATLRPDTLQGITNVYVDPEEEYQKIIVKNCDSESWIISKAMVEKLFLQNFEMEITGVVSGETLVGQKVESVIGSKVLVLPASFLDSNYGSGIVHSVPSDSADDLIALRNLQNDEKTITRFGLDPDEIKAIEPIAIFDTPEIGKIPADYFLKKYNIKSQNERSKLDAIKKELYTLTFNKSKFNKKYDGIFSKNLSGMLVKDGQEIIKNELLKDKKIYKFYELSGKVVSRTLAECVVKIVDDQWFIDYNNPDWKKLAHKCISKMNFYPESARSHFDYVVDWLHEWACTREEGLGTKLPWDNKWLIESLSDSTIYMAYYTIAHLIKNIPIDEVNDSFFDYVFLRKGKKPNVKNIDKFVDNFDYFYPLDFRNSGKDLIQNHLTFFIFNHVALFPEDKWPKGIGVNGWVTVDGQKMSKSLGNMVPVRRIVSEYSADSSRITILNGGEELNDPNWDTNFAKSISSKLLNLLDVVRNNYNKHERLDVGILIDSWFESEINRIVLEAEQAMEKTQFRTAIQKIYFEMQNIFKHYMKRTKNNPNKNLVNQWIENQIIMLSPFAPHICEEAWESIGKQGFVSSASWPNYDKKLIHPSLNIREDFIDQVLSDVKTTQELAKISKISKITLIRSEDWKYKLFKIVGNEFRNGNRDFKQILSILMSNNEFKKYGEEVTKLLPSLIKKGISNYISAKDEESLKSELSELLKQEFDAEIEYKLTENSKEPKAKQAMPGKPAIILE